MVSVRKTGTNDLTWTFSQVYTVAINFDGLGDDSAAVDFANPAAGTNAVVMTYVDPVSVGDGWTVDPLNVDATWASGLPLPAQAGTVT